MFTTLASSVRLGFATNSSSSHSILLVDPDALASLEALGWQPAVRGSYGWDWFALTTAEEKRDYLWTNLCGQILSLLPRNPPINPAGELSGILPELDANYLLYAQQLASKILEHYPRPFDSNEAVIDHDSTFSLPLDPQSHAPHVGFARWYRDMLLDPQVVILGGNDNEAPVGLPKRKGKKKNRVPARPAGEDRRLLADDEFARPLTCYDRGDHWLLFAPQTGLKLRIPKVPGAAVDHTSVPELVDIKVTDHCGMGCKFCYQDSTLKGSHSALSPGEMSDLIRALDVREVAIGGGEPLDWPHLWEFVSFLTPKAVLNITTRKPEEIPFWKLPLFGGIGYSVESAKVLQQTLTRLGFKAEEYGNPWRKKLVIHIVLGATPVEEIVQICRIAESYGLEVLLLAYKTDGRGAKFKPIQHENWIDTLKEAFWDAAGGFWKGPKLGIDTPTAERWGAELREKLQVDPKLMSLGEGKFSLYLDFVTQTFAKASYGGEGRKSFTKKTGEQQWNWPQVVGRQILEEFRSWHR